MLCTDPIHCYHFFCITTVRRSTKVSLDEAQFLRYHAFESFKHTFTDSFLFSFTGTGLGITISNMIMSALGGVLVAFSAPEYGSCFTFAIPVKLGKKIVEDTPVESKEATKLRIEQLQNEFEAFGFGEEGKRKRPRVLVVDDSTINRKICSRKIKKLLPNVEITECSNGQTCIQEYEHDHQNIMGIFLDFHMPGALLCS